METKISHQKLLKFNEEVKNRKNAKNLDSIVQKLIKDIPEEERYLKECIEFNEGLLGHIYFEDYFSKNLLKLLDENKDDRKIQKYCDFIEYMWRYGDEAVVNIFDVSIAEGLACYPEKWKKFGKHISNELIDYINEVLIPNNVLMNLNEVLDKNS